MSILEIRRSLLYHRPIPKSDWDGMARWHAGMTQRFAHILYGDSERANLTAIYFDLVERMRAKYYPEPTGGEQWDRRRT